MPVGHASTVLTTMSLPAAQIEGPSRKRPKLMCPCRHCNGKEVSKSTYYYHMENERKAGPEDVPATNVETEHQMEGMSTDDTDSDQSDSSTGK